KGEVNLRARCGSGYSFNSSHATNHFALAFFWIVLFKRKWKHTVWLAFLWAISISFSQIYVGVHYPLDIVFGALIGTIIGLSTGYLFKRFYPKFFEPQNTSTPTLA